MRTVRGFTVAALSATMTLALTGLLGSQPVTFAATPISPTWHTTASYRPLPNLSAVSCAPTSGTCVAVGDDGGNVSSIAITQNGGSTWSDAAPPAGMTTLATVSCPSTAVCYAGGGSGIMKSSDGGANWTIQDSSFPAESISCFTIDECTAVGGLGIAHTTDGQTWNTQTSPAGLNSLGSVSCPDSLTCVATGVLASRPSIIGTQNGSTWMTLDSPRSTN